MKNKMMLPLMGLMLCVAAMPLRAQAQETGSLPYYDVGDVQYKKEYYMWKTYLEYQLNREPCQRYQPLPAGYVMNGCDFERAAPKQVEAPAAVFVPAPVPVPAPAPTAAAVYFGFDSAVIPEAEKAKIDKAAAAIGKSGATHVTVGGHTSTAGTATHNMALSQKRADAVTQALVDRGVKKDYITDKGYGETDLAVPTADGVKMPENRRAVIEWDK